METDSVANYDTAQITDGVTNAIGPIVTSAAMAPLTVLGKTVQLRNFGR